MNRRDVIKLGCDSGGDAADVGAGLSGPADPADRAVLAGRRDRRGRPHLGGADEAQFGTVVTENKGGGGGVIGATEVARARAQGETLLFGNTSTQVIIPAISDHPRTIR
jgi:hypothetical protein